MASVPMYGGSSAPRTDVSGAEAEMFASAEPRRSGNNAFLFSHFKFPLLGLQNALQLWVCERKQKV